MSVIPFSPESLPGALRCVRCSALHPAGHAACRQCLAPLNETGVVSGLSRPNRLPRVLGVSLLACITLVGGLAAFPNTPVRNLHDRLFGSGSGPAVTSSPVLSSSVPDDPEAGDRGKFEPAEGCYVGAYVIQDVNISGSMKRWIELTGKGHASYLRYVGYGQPFPSEWVASVREVGAVPNLALEPNAGLPDVRDDAYLRKFARDAAASGGPVFLRFASEMNGPWTMYHGHPKKYRWKFRLVSRVMREEAPNVAMVWTPYCRPHRPIPDYYPGDDVVDWVGVNVYSVHHHDGDINHPAHFEDPTDLLRPVYELYADRKPIQVSEYAATHYCKACDQYTADFAMKKMIRMYRSLPRRFPRVKLIYWFSFDTVSGKAAENNYSVIDDPVIRDTYRRLIAPDYFLPSLPAAGDAGGRDLAP